MSLYRVTGEARFQGFDPGETFVAELDARLEERAVRRGAIEVLRRGDVALDLTRAAMPRGWHLKGDKQWQASA